MQQLHEPRHLQLERHRRGNRDPSLWPTRCRCLRSWSLSLHQHGRTFAGRSHALEIRFTQLQWNELRAHARRACEFDPRPTDLGAQARQVDFHHTTREGSRQFGRAVWRKSRGSQVLKKCLCVSHTPTTRWPSLCVRLRPRSPARCGVCRPQGSAPQHTRAVRAAIPTLSMRCS